MNCATIDPSARSKGALGLCARVYILHLQWNASVCTVCTYHVCGRSCSDLLPGALFAALGSGEWESGKQNANKNNVGLRGHMLQHPTSRSPSETLEEVLKTYDGGAGGRQRRRAVCCWTCAGGVLPPLVHINSDHDCAANWLVPTVPPECDGGKNSEDELEGQHHNRYQVHDLVQAQAVKTHQLVSPPCNRHSSPAYTHT